MCDNSERQAFEKWASTHFFLQEEDTIVDDSDEYISGDMQLAWEAYHAGCAQAEPPSAAVVPEGWRKAARGAIEFAKDGLCETHPLTAAEHIKGMASLILSAAPQSENEALRAQAGEAIASKYNDCACGDLMASGEFVCDNCMAAYNAGIVPSGHVMISAEEYDFLRKQAGATHPTDSGGDDDKA